MAFHIKSEDRISLICFAYPYSKALAIGLIGLISLPAISLEAPTGYDGLTNGYLNQADYQLGLDEFNKVQTLPDGLGPVFNDVSCHRAMDEL